ncbi:hypothetical protein BUALT_Bualt13G0014000 [Buddleja alternifolia]|uniref:Bifunctional inhibitor/plant lipid transfer protein/seed storage helical domain-containing protein n=1 Tax=Buddleja alternifolia TaxID=168488 RepID=A0AAV6WUV8_9LAMI|nr:hypothetical protein BUALT_Bualt13G0014000 [Buddleja alternifolia]
MATTKYIEMGLVLVLAVMLIRGATAQSSCSSTLMSLASCVNYVTGNITTPSSSCCSSLSNVVQSQPQCLCPLLNGVGSTFGISINQTLALALPSVCNVQTPPVARCNAAAGPATATAPAPSPTDASTEPAEGPTTTIPSTPSGNAGTGSKTVPNTRGSTSDGNSITSSIQFMKTFTLFIVAWTANTLMF